MARSLPGHGSRVTFGGRLKILELASKKQMLAYLLVGILRMGIRSILGKMHDSDLFVPGCGNPGSYDSPSVATMMALMV